MELSFDCGKREHCSFPALWGLANCNSYTSKPPNGLSFASDNKKSNASISSEADMMQVSSWCLSIFQNCQHYLNREHIKLLYPAIAQLSQKFYFHSGLPRARVNLGGGGGNISRTPAPPGTPTTTTKLFVLAGGHKLKQCKGRGQAACLTPWPSSTPASILFLSSSPLWNRWASQQVRAWVRACLV